MIRRLPRPHHSPLGTLHGGHDIERLEPRQLLAAVSWTGNAGDNLWQTPSNWSSNALPTIADDVTIDVPPGPTIRFAGSAAAVKSLVTRNNLSVDGSRLTVSTFATVDGAVALTLAGGTLEGGSYSYLNGGTLVLSSSGGTLKDVATNTDLLLDAANKQLTIAGTTTFNAVRMTASATTLSIAAGYTLSSLISAEGATTGTRTIRMASGGAGTVTIGPTGVVRSLLGSTLDILDASPAVLQNDGTISVEQPNDTLNIGVTTFVNNGTIRSLHGLLSVSAASMAGTPNSKLINAASDSRTRLLSPSWSHLGTTTMGGGSLNLGGGFSTSGFNFAGIAFSGGLIYLSGTLNNTNSVLALNNTNTGLLQLFGGTIMGGAITYAGSARLVITSTGGTLDGVAVSGELRLSESSGVVLLKGNTTFANLRVTDNSTVNLAPGYTISSPITLQSSSTLKLVLGFGGPGTVTISPTGVIRSASASGILTLTSSTATTLENYGLISGEAATQTLRLSNTSFINHGIVQVFSGTLDIASGTMTGLSSSMLSVGPAGTLKLSSPSWSNAGGLTLDSGTLTLGGSFSTTGLHLAAFARSGGTVNLTGALSNTGSTLALNAVTGSWNLAGGSISGGAITFASGVTLTTTSLGGTLSNVAIAGDLVLNTTSASVQIQGTTSFTSVKLAGKSATLKLAPGYVLNSVVSVEGAFPGDRVMVISYGGSGAVTFGPAAIVRIAPGAGGGLDIQGAASASLTNNGLLQGLASGTSLTIHPGTFANVGTIDAAGSDVFINSTLANLSSGTLTGGTWKASASGSINGPAGLIKTLDANVLLISASKGWDALNTLESVKDGATLWLGGGTGQAISPASGTFSSSGSVILGAGSRLSINGNFAQSESGSLTCDVAGTNAVTGFGSITATGTGALAGKLIFVTVDGYVPARGDSQNIIATAGVTTGTFSKVTGPQPMSLDLQTAVRYTANGASLVTTSAIDFNLDGQVDLQDYFDFFDRWDVNDAGLDLNHDGSVDLGDFFLFFDLWDKQ